MRNGPGSREQEPVAVVVQVDLEDLVDLVDLGAQLDPLALPHLSCQVAPVGLEVQSLP